MEPSVANKQQAADVCNLFPRFWSTNLSTAITTFSIMHVNIINTYIFLLQNQTENTTTKFSLLFPSPASYAGIADKSIHWPELTLSFTPLFCCSAAFSGSWPMCLLSKGEPNTVEWVSELPWQQNLTAGCNGNVIESEEQTFTYWVGSNVLRLAAGQVVLIYSAVDGFNLGKTLQAKMLLFMHLSEHFCLLSHRFPPVYYKRWKQQNTLLSHFINSGM